MTGVADLAVIGVPDDRWGETVKAIVVRDRLAHYKGPTSVGFVGELSRNASGKTLREPYWTPPASRAP